MLLCVSAGRCSMCTRTRLYPPPLSPPQVDWLRLKGFSVVMCNDNRWLEQADTLCDLSICRGWRLMNHKVFGIIPDFATMHTEHRGGGGGVGGVS